MRTVQATESAVSIWFSQEDAPSRRQLLLLVRKALEERGLPPWPATEAECFAAGEETLVIARPAAHALGFYFDDLESLLAGARACPGGETSLYTEGEGYVLTLAPEEGCPALYEYGAPWPVRPGWEIHAREQGRCLLAGDAAQALCRFFPT